MIKLITFVLTSVLIYFGIAVTMIVIDKPKKPEKINQSFGFKELFFDYSGLPELKKYVARDGVRLSYRYYPVESDKVIVLLHGSGWHSQYFLPLARFISSEGLAKVYTPDLRGHGPGPVRRGDVDYICQLEDDLADLLDFIREQNPKNKLIVGGHSSGGGLALRFAGSQYGNQADAYLMLSPFLKYNAPTIRLNSGGWALPYTKRIIGLTMLNNIGIHLFDYLPAIRFNMSKEARNGTETLVYSHRLNTAFAPRDYKKDLQAISQPLMVVAGTADNAFIAEEFEPVISPYTSVVVELLPGVSHMGVVVGPEIRIVIKKWLESLPI